MNWFFPMLYYFYNKEIGIPTSLVIVHSASGIPIFKVHQVYASDLTRAYLELVMRTNKPAIILSALKGNRGFTF
jgi:hypothetical protein